MLDQFDDAKRRFTILVNGSGQYSLWPVDRRSPAGWRPARTNLSSAEAQHLIDELSAAEPPLPPAAVTRTSHDLVDALAVQAVRRPDATAVLTRGRTGPPRKLTYQELDDRAETLAQRLCRLGAGPEMIVAVALPRDEDLIVALLAVLKAGAAYLPIDLGFPPARTSVMVGDDAAPCLLVSRSDSVRHLPSTHTPRLLLDASTASDPVGPWTSPDARPEHAAYVLYTSGSTG